MHDHNHHDHEPHQHGDHGHAHSHDRAPDEPATLTRYQAMEVALRELLIEKGILNAAEIRRTLERIDARSPMQGARMVARAWVDPAFRQRMLQDGTAAAKELDIEPAWLKLIVVENTPTLHNVVVCTLCSCYPWPLIGLPPDWYKSPAYRSRVVRDPRAVLAEFGTQIPRAVDIRVHDSTADMRYLVMPMRPPGSELLSEAALADLVTRDSMIGVATASTVGDRAS